MVAVSLSVPPTITGIDLTSDPGGDDTYAIGDAIEATVTFNGAVTVTGTPQMALDVGGAARTADYASGSGSTDLVFRYTVVEGDLDADGVAVEKDEIDLNGGTITAGATAATLTYDAVAADPDHKVDGVRPILENATVEPDGTSIELVFDEPYHLAGGSAALTTGQFTVTAAGSALTIGNYGFVDEITGHRGFGLKELSPAISSGQTVVVTYTDPTTGDDTTGVIQDAGGNDLASFTTGSGGVPAVANNVPAAPTFVPTIWSLVPSGLGDGDSFRLLFIGSNTRNASSSDIDVYNTFVQDLAAGGHLDIRAHSATFRMIGSTENADARDNTGTTGAGVPIYWLGGAKVADDYADFYDGDWDEEATGARARPAWTVSIDTELEGLDGQRT